MAGVERRRRSAGAWRVLIDGQQASGLTIETYCRREGVSTASFYRWRDRQCRKAASLTPKRVPTVDSPAGFLDLGAITAHALPQPPPSSLRVLLHIGSFRLQIERG